MSDSDIIQYHVVNQVVTVNFNLDPKKVDLQLLARQNVVFWYCPWNFAAASVCFDAPRGTVLLFPSGYGVVTGASSEINAVMVAQHAVTLLHRCGYKEARLSDDYRIQNVVVSFSCGFRVELTKLADLFSVKGNCSTVYTPDQFPGAWVRRTIFHRKTGTRYRIVYTIFISGQVIMAGGKNEETIREDVYWIRDKVLVHCRKQDNSLQSSADYRRHNKHIEQDQVHERLQELFLDASMKHISKSNTVSGDISWDELMKESADLSAMTRIVNELTS
jgi:TATA-box binding protein (TBP) (component of TFIID and TFIIIB)